MTEYERIEERDRRFRRRFCRVWWMLAAVALACVIVAWLFRW